MLSALAWLPRGAAKPIPRAAAPTEEELAEAARLQAAAAAAKGRRGGSSGDSDGGDGASSSSGWETDDSGSDDDGMEDDGPAPPTPAPGPDLARAKKAAARVKAAGAPSWLVFFFLGNLDHPPTPILFAHAHTHSPIPTHTGKSAATNDPALDAAMAALDMDNYDREDETDDDDEEDGGEGGEGGTAKGSRRVLDGLFGGDDAALYYASNADDPYMALARGAAARGSGGEAAGADAAAPDAPPASDSEDEDAWDLRPTDFVLAAARTEDDVSTLEVWVYEAGAAGPGGANLYVHHDLLLGAFPLSLAWMDCAPGGGGGADRANFVAVGTMDPVVELWDLDAADAVAPVATLGGGGGDGAAKADSKKKKKKGTKAAAKAAAKAGGPHAGAVLGLAWNAAVRNVLASASADEAVKVWDVAAPGPAPVTTLTHHTDKVQALAWHPADPAVLLSGGFDGRACLTDVRAAPGGGAATTTPAWAVGADVEALAWDPAHPTRFCVAAEDGHVTCFDARAGGGSAPLFTLGAHARPTTGLAFAGAAAPGLLATGSTDKSVKLWDVAGPAPVCVEAQDLKVGAVFALAFAADEALPGVLGVAGAKGTVSVWEVGASDKVGERWPALKV